MNGEVKIGEEKESLNYSSNRKEEIAKLKKVRQQLLNMLISSYQNENDTLSSQEKLEKPKIYKKMPNKFNTNGLVEGFLVT